MVRLKLANDLIFEVVGGELMVCDPTAGVVHKLSGASASAVESLHADPTARVDAKVADQLVAAGIAVRIVPLTTRRNVLVGGSVLATGGVFSMMLPSAAAAASHPEGGLGDIGGVGGNAGGGNGGAGGQFGGAG